MDRPRLLSCTLLLTPRATPAVFSVQKHFGQELTVHEIFTVLRRGRAISNACSMLKVLVQDRSDFSLVDATSIGVLRSDYLAVR